MGGQVQQVRGVILVSGLAFVRSELGAEARAALVDGARPEHRQALDAPDPGRFYPEEACQDMLHGYHALAQGDEGRYAQMLRRAALSGVDGFFQILHRMTSPRETLQRLPLLWQDLRRGPATMRAEAADGLVWLRYAHFPFFADPVYPPFVVALVGGVLEAVGGYTPPVHILEQGDDSLALEIRV